MLARLGADVIKVESVTPPRPHALHERRQPPTEDGGGSGARCSTARTTPSAASRSTSRAGAAATCSCGSSPTPTSLIENFTPRVMDNFGLGWDALHDGEPAPRDGPACPRTASTARGATAPASRRRWRASPGMAWVTGLARRPAAAPARRVRPARRHARGVRARCSRSATATASGHGRLVEVTMIEAALNAAAEQVVEHARRRHRCSSGRATAARSRRRRTCTACAGDEEWLALAVVDRRAVGRAPRRARRPRVGARPALATADGRRAAHDAHRRPARRVVPRPRTSPSSRTRSPSAGVPAGARRRRARHRATTRSSLHRGFFEVERPPGHRRAPRSRRCRSGSRAAPRAVDAPRRRPRSASTTTRCSAALLGLTDAGAGRAARPRASSATARWAHDARRTRRLGLGAPSSTT